MSDSQTPVQAAKYVTVKLAASITGLSEKAIRRKMEEGKWIEGREYVRSPDGGIFICMKGYEQWVELGMGSRYGRRASVSSSPITARSAAKD